MPADKYTKKAKSVKYPSKSSAYTKGMKKPKKMNKKKR